MGMKTTLAVERGGKGRGSGPGRALGTLEGEGLQKVQV